MLHSDYPLQACCTALCCIGFFGGACRGIRRITILVEFSISFTRDVRSGYAGSRRSSGGGVQLATTGVADQALSDLVDAGGGGMRCLEWRQAFGATGLLRVFTDAGVLESSDVHVAQRLTSLASEPVETVALAVALVVRALRNGSVCVDLRSLEQQVGVEGLPWPDVDEWLAAARASPLAGMPPALRVEGDLLYLDRYWREEQQVCDDVLRMVSARPRQVSPDIDRLFPAGFEEQRAAAEVALSQGLTVLTGGPGRARPRRWRGCWRCSRGHAIAGSRWRHRPERQRRGCKTRCSWKSRS